MTVSACCSFRPRRANSVVDATTAHGADRLRAAPAMAIRCAASMNVKEVLRERTGPQGQGGRRKCLIGKGLPVRSGAGADGRTPPPLRFGQPAARGPELLAPRKMGRPLGGCGGSRVDFAAAGEVWRG
jgi:hypothetical protein